ncbi:hypothetical protein GCM10009504_28520 [Pseudomonas laurentiana]|nr:hypothetical protein GCM10009504_28520 [Pseudomonas laurentiana]
MSLIVLSSMCLLLTGCDNSPKVKNEIIGRPASLSASTPATPAVAPVPPAPTLTAEISDEAGTLEDDALNLAVSSPEAAAKLATKAPESVAAAARLASEKSLGELSASPESSMVKLNAYAQLTKEIAKFTPGSGPVAEAAKATESARLRALNALNDTR